MNISNVYVRTVVQCKMTSALTDTIACLSGLLKTPFSVHKHGVDFYIRKTTSWVRAVDYPIVYFMFIGDIVTVN